MCLHTNSQQDPTATYQARRKAFSEIRRRKQAAMKEIRDYVQRIPVTTTEVPETVVTNRRVYLYELQDRDTYRDIREIIERWFGTGGDNPPTRWFMDAQIEEVVTRATTQEASRINALAGAIGISDPYQIERILMSPEFRERIRRVRNRVFEELKGFTTDTANDLGRTLADQMAQGKGVRTVTGALTERFNIKESRARTIARTELGVAHRETRRDQTRDARDRLGLNALEQWVSALAPTTRPSHADRHLKLYTPEEVAAFYSKDANAINCYIPGTKVQGNFTAGSKGHYSGEVIEIMTRGGRNLTVTPNHPIMANGGLIPAAKIAEGDNLVAYIGENEDSFGVPALDRNLANSRIEDVFSSMMDLGHSFSARVGAVDFHGDGRLMDKNVDVVVSNRVLQATGNPSISKLLKDFSLISTNSKVGLMKGFCSRVLDFVGVNLTSSGFLGFKSNPLLVRFRLSNIPRVLGFGRVSPCIASISKPSVDSNPRCSSSIGYRKYGFSRLVSFVKRINIKSMLTSAVLSPVKSCFSHSSSNGSGGASVSFSDCLNSHSRLVERDEVVSVRKRYFSGHVYDLQDVSGLMIANDIIASNCLCVQQTVLVTEDGEIVGERKITERDKREIERIKKGA